MITTYKQFINENVYPTVWENAIHNTPEAQLLPDGSIKLHVSRYQKHEQAGELSVRTGVFYLPEVKSPYSKHYRNKVSYGGKQYITGWITVHKPYILQSGTGGLGPEKAYINIVGKGEFDNLITDIMSLIGYRSFRMTKYQLSEEVEKVLTTHGGNPDIAWDIVQHSDEGNRIRYAIQEHIIAHALRDKGYDSVLSYSKSGGDFRLSELFYLEQDYYPDQDSFVIT